MENAETILVIFLSGALLVFLILGIILISICIKIANHVKAISEKAEAVADKAENFADLLGRTTGPLVIGRIISQVVDIFGKSKGSRNRKDD